MSASMNKVILIGNLTMDPDLKYTESGTALAKFNIAINHRYKDKSGQQQEDVTFVPIVVWGTQAENCANYLAKGRSVMIEGRLQIKNYEKDGIKKKSIDVTAQNIQFLGGGKSVEETRPTTDDEAPPF